MAKTQDKTRQVGGSTVCRVKFELIDKRAERWRIRRSSKRL